MVMEVIQGVTIRFEEVGREKRSWDQWFGNPTDANIIRAARKGGFLMSRDIDLSYDDEKNVGYIFAGMRAVGKFSIAGMKGGAE